MGWFDWLRAEPANIETLPEVIWVNDAAKYAGINAAVDSICQASPPPPALALIAHFSQTLHALRRIAAEHAVSFPIEVRLATGLSERDFTVSSAGSQRPIEVIVAERHPHEREDAALDSALKRTPYQYRVTHHHSFDDAIFQIGGWSSRARKVMEMLGMNESEPIHSKVVVRKLRRLQRRVSRQATGSLPATRAAIGCGSICQRSNGTPARCRYFASCVTLSGLPSSSISAVMNGVFRSAPYK